mmetsp:Transcript_4048/g.8897  ORF Transcript_4048/g.8897 Transcript_4048/m.8897 type:complete len:318 (-) Transcript_4048:390-1343(-)
MAGPSRTSGTNRVSKVAMRRAFSRGCSPSDSMSFSSGGGGRPWDFSSRFSRLVAQVRVLWRIFCTCSEPFAFVQLAIAASQSLTRRVASMTSPGEVQSRSWASRLLPRARRISMSCGTLLSLPDPASPPSNRGRRSSCAATSSSSVARATPAPRSSTRASGQKWSSFCWKEASLRVSSRLIVPFSGTIANASGTAHSCSCLGRKVIPTTETTPDFESLDGIRITTGCLYHSASCCSIIPRSITGVRSVYSSTLSRSWYASSCSGPLSRLASRACNSLSVKVVSSPTLLYQVRTSARQLSISHSSFTRSPSSLERGES